MSKGNEEGIHLKNEEKVLALVQELLEAETGSKLERIEKPDDVERTLPAVDLILGSAVQLFSIEHTCVEAFPEQFRSDIHVAAFGDAVVEQAEAAYQGPGHLEAWLPLDAVGAVRKRARPPCAKALATWIAATGSGLEVYDYDPDSEFDTARAHPPGVPFEVVLRRTRGLDGRVFLGRFLPDENRRALMRTEAVDHALSRKIPKLRADAEDRGAEAVLVLELQAPSLGGLKPVFDRVGDRLRADGGIEWLVCVNTASRGQAYHGYMLNVKRGSCALFFWPESSQLEVGRRWAWW